MKQLLIVNSAKALGAGTNVTADDFSGLDKGAIVFFESGFGTLTSTMIDDLSRTNFGIALGRGANKPAFVIPEVDISTLEIVHTLPYKGEAFEVTFTMPTTIVGKEYTVILVKKGVVTHERNVFTTSIVAKTTTAATEAIALRKAINDKTSEMFPFVASGSGASIVLTCQISGEDWEIKFADALFGTSTSALTHGRKAIGDKEYILDFAQHCAANKGFVYLDGESMDINPGFPEDVESFELNTSGENGSSTTGYKIYHLRFATGRAAGKQVDERVWQYVHIAVPLNNPSIDALDNILPEGEYPTA